jgi:ribosomal protein S18 acetylase RimI-like enzyme
MGKEAALDSVWPIDSLGERPATDADYDALWRLHIDSMQRYVAATYGWEDAVQEAMFREYWPKSPPRRLLVDRETDRVVASWVVERRADEVYLVQCEVASTHQRRGLGTAIVRRLLAEAAESRLPATLRVMKANPDARRLYERLGFSVDGETPTHYLMRAVPL